MTEVQHVHREALPKKVYERELLRLQEERRARKAEERQAKGGDGGGEAAG